MFRWDDHSRRRAVDYLVYLAVRSVVCLLQSMSVEGAYAFVKPLACLAYFVDKRHRQVAIKNLESAFGDQYTPAQRQAMVWNVYDHFFRVFVEFVFIPRKLHVHNWKKYVTFECPPATADMFVQDRSKIIVTGHFGNWEMAGYLLAVIGMTPTSIARDLDNPYLHQFVERFRRWSGQKIVSKKGDFDQIVETLRDRQPLVTVADQSAGVRGLFVDFFGRPASTHKAISLLALEHDSPVIVGYAYRDRRDFHYKVVASLAMEPRDYAGRVHPVADLTQDFTFELEEAIRRAPDQYLWLHDRWKHQPAPRVRKQAA
ncbi:lysophospholipid acyltransferase family protein [bacterium]|nr:lysophospholipid acyltransferase family protein [bacterium]